YLFDYGRGAFPFLEQGKFPEMPQTVIRQSPISLWNTALEFHTARIYAALTGDFYILIIPLAGLSILFIIISGLWMYWSGFRKKRIRRK
ncbi:MAG: PepSY domain-containing protein, partial [Bacteroidales bacterium]|nr:PepSY domain-containing protein [Bacteroidales bacterium]